MVEERLQYNAADDESIHVMPVRTYLWVWLALMVLLVATVGVAYIDFGRFDRVVMLSIAIAKAGLIMVYFMHLRHSSRLVLIFATMGFFWLVIMFLITMGDYVARDGIQFPVG